MKPHHYTPWQQRAVLALEREDMAIEAFSLSTLGLVEYQQALGMTELQYEKLLKQHIRALIRAGLLYDCDTNALGTFYRLTDAGVTLRRMLLSSF